VGQTGESEDCALGVALNDAASVAVSSDGRHVYVASFTSEGVAAFDRDASTGALTQKTGLGACILENGAQEGCTDGVALGGAESVAVTVDGRNVYVATIGSDSVVVLDRDLSTGVLTQKAGVAGCVSETGTGGACTLGVALKKAFSVAVSHDGRNVYVTGQSSDAVVVFDRDIASGVLTQKAGVAGCISETGTAGACTNGVGLNAASGVVVSPDSRNVYVASLSSHAVAVFDRDLSTGELTQKAGQAGCIRETGTSDCTDGVALGGALSVAVSPDGQSVYVAALASDALGGPVRSPVLWTRLHQWRSAPTV
jgi:DNA-binding beta-propeller fold protein YncE